MAALMYQAERSEEEAGVEARGRENDGLVEPLGKFDDLFKRLPSVFTARNWKKVFMKEVLWRKKLASVVASQMASWASW